MKRILYISSLFVTLVFSEVKIGWIDSNEIMNKYEPVRQVQIDLEKEGRRLELEVTKLAQQRDSLFSEYQRQQSLMSVDRRTQKEEEITNLEMQIQRYQMEKFGPEGELARKQVQLMQPITIKIQEAIDVISVERGFDYVLDAAGGALVYTLPQNNLTEDVIEQLNKLNSGNNGE